MRESYILHSAFCVLQSSFVPAAFLPSFLSCSIYTSCRLHPPPPPPPPPPPSLPPWSFCHTHSHPDSLRCSFSTYKHSQRNREKKEKRREEKNRCTPAAFIYHTYNRLQLHPATSTTKRELCCCVWRKDLAQLLVLEVPVSGFAAYSSITPFYLTAATTAIEAAATEAATTTGQASGSPTVDECQ
ncbi:hypothetical protein GQ42DRAFT_31145 [Ramicandelaber brevisporus]|nr:hypothetical protein GQ42DRAFT_31145 [Ramicandelaber brevisporus]